MEKKSWQKSAKSTIFFLRFCKPKTERKSKTMKAKSIGYLAGIITLTLTANAGLAPNASEVVKLTKSGVSEDVATSYVRNVSTPFNLSADDILALKAQGVSPQTIAAMLNHDTMMRNMAQTPYMQPPLAVPPAAYAQPQPNALYNQPPATTYYPQDVIPESPGPDYYWSPGYWDNGLWIGPGWCYGGLGVGLGWWPWGWGYGWGGYGRGFYGGYGRGYYGGYRGGYGGYRGGISGFRGGVGGFRGGVGGFRGGVGGFRGGVGGGHGGGFGGGHGGGGGHR